MHCELARHPFDFLIGDEHHPLGVVRSFLTEPLHEAGHDEVHPLCVGSLQSEVTNEAFHLRLENSCLALEPVRLDAGCLAHALGSLLS